MKKIILTSIVLFAVASLCFAQPRREMVDEKIQSMRIAFITSKLNLTPEESQRFWPIYNQFHAEEKALRKSQRSKGDLMTMTDAEAEALVMQNLEVEEKVIQLKRDNIQQLKMAIPIKKIAMLQRVEREFKTQLLRQMRKNGDKRDGRKNRRF